MAQTTLRLVVTTETPQLTVDRHVDRIEHLHPANRGKVNVVRWDGSAPLESYADRQTRLYADPGVAECLTKPDEIADWGRRWKLVSKVQSRFAGESKSARALPLYVFSGGASGVTDLEQSIVPLDER